MKIVRTANIAQGWLEGIIPFSVYALFIYLISYRVLPFHGGVINYSDGAYFWPGGGFDFLSAWYAGDLGVPFIAQSFTAFLYVPNKLTELITGFAGGDAYQSYLLFYLPIYASCISAYYLGRKVSGNIYYGYFAGFFIILNNFILEQLLAWPVSYFYCLSGLLLQALVLWNMHEKGVTVTRAIALVMISLLAAHPFMFACQLLFLTVFLGFFCIQKKMLYSAAIAMVGGVVLINSYWIIPFLYSFIAATVSETYAGGEGALYGFIATVNYRNLFNLLNYPFYTSAKHYNYIHNSAQFFFNVFLLVSVIALTLTTLLRSTTRRKEVLFFLVVYLMFFNIALGPKSVITGDLWWWSYEHIPGFGFLRSFNRFYILAIIALMILGGVLAKTVRFRYANSFLILVIAVNFISNDIFFSGNMKGLVKAYNVPAEYYQLNQNYLNKESGYVLSLPLTTYESYSWTKNERFDVYNNPTHFLPYFLAAPVILSAPGTGLDYRYPEYEDILVADKHAASFDNWEEKIKKLSIRYVLVHKDKLDSLSSNSKIVAWNKYWRYFSSNRDYILREDNQYYSLFELKDYKAIVSGENVTFTRISQNKYELVVRNLNKPVTLRFAQGFHPGWKIYAQDTIQSNNSGQEKIRSQDVGGGKNQFQWGDMSFLFNPPLLGEASHLKLDSFANGWTLDPAEIRNNLKPGSYEVSPDGSLRLDLILYFKPQSLLLISKVCTLLVLALCPVILLMVWFKKRPSH